MEESKLKRITVLFFAVVFQFIALGNINAQDWPATQTLLDIFKFIDSLRSEGAGNYGINGMYGTFLQAGQSSVYGTELNYNEYLGFVIVGDNYAQDISANIYDSRHRVVAEGEYYGRYLIVENTMEKKDSYKMQVTLNRTDSRGGSFIAVAGVKRGALFNYMDYVNAAKNLEEAYMKLMNKELSNYEVTFASDPEYVDDYYTNTYSFCLSGMYYKLNQGYGMTGNGMTKNTDYCILSASNAGAKKLDFTLYSNTEVLLGSAKSYAPYVLFNSGKYILYSYYIKNLESNQDLFVVTCTMKLSKLK